MKPKKAFSHTMAYRLTATVSHSLAMNDSPCLSI